MWKAKSIIGKWQFIYHTNNSLYRGWSILPTIKIAYLSVERKYDYTHSFWIRFDWFSFSCSVNRLSQ